MELQTFEQAILKLAFETNARITTASVAYYLGIPSREATRMLNSLLEEGVLELDSDASGNLYYQVPNNPSDLGSFGSLPQMPPPLPTEGAVDAPPTEEPKQPAKVSPSFLTATIEDDGVAEPPTAKVPPPAAFEHVRSPEAQPTRKDLFGKKWGDARESSHTTTKRIGGFSSTDGEDGSAGSRAMTFKPTFSTVSSRVASPDASLDRCGGSSVVVSGKVRCEPRPLPAAKPMIVSCSDSTAMVEQRQEQSWFGPKAESTSTALVPAGQDTALARDYYIEQPEHQPGMALLLSLILCGTGQIYNGEVSKGIMMMVLCFLLWFVLLGWVVHIWSIVDAVVVAERLNRRQA